MVLFLSIALRQISVILRRSTHGLRGSWLASQRFLCCWLFSKSHIEEHYVSSLDCEQFTTQGQRRFNIKVLRDESRVLLYQTGCKGLLLKLVGCKDETKLQLKNN